LSSVFLKNLFTLFWPNSYSDPVAGLGNQQKSAATEEPQKTTPAIGKSGGCQRLVIVDRYAGIGLCQQSPRCIWFCH
jgi:hypothetical protein